MELLVKKRAFSQFCVFEEKWRTGGELCCSQLWRTAWKQCSHRDR